MLKTIGTGKSFQSTYIYCNILDYHFKFCSILTYLLHESFIRYEWKQRGHTHIHGFLWLEGAPNI